NADVRRMVEGGSASTARPGRPSRPTSFLEASLLYLLQVEVPHTLTDADCFRLIAETVSQLTAETVTAEQVKQRATRGRQYAKEHPFAKAPPVAMQPSRTSHAADVQKGLRDSRESDDRLRKFLSKSRRIST